MKNQTRRRFMRVSAMLGGGVVGGMIPVQRLIATQSKPPKPMRILILGGTGFIGPYQVRYAISRGHKVTVFNRGKSHTSELPKEVEQLLGDRNGQLDALKNREWDVAIDNPTTLPAWVRDAAEILKGHVERYVFVSTISVYADMKGGPDENAPLAKYDGPDPYKESDDTVIASGFKLYGPLKALSEQETEKWFPNQSLIIRPGLIVGPGDDTDRFTYWPVRVDRGGEVLAPGDATDPVQFIDARDLAEWTIRMAENREVGIYNATGPEKELGIGEMLGEIKAALNANPNFTWVPADFLREQKISPWLDMPVWVPPASKNGGMARTKVQHAVAKGLTFRPLAETSKDTLRWFKSLPSQRQERMRAGLSPQREQETLAAWRKAKT